MIRLLLILILAGLIALGAVWLADHDGFVTLTLAGYEIRARAAVAAVILLGLVAVLLILMRVAVLIMRGPANVRGFLAKRRARNAYHTLSKGLIAAAAGDAPDAEQAARHAEKLLGVEPLVLLLRAEAARLSGDEKREEGVYRAMLAHPDTEYLAVCRLYGLAKRRHNEVEVQAFAARARALKPLVPLETIGANGEPPPPEVKPQMP
jgi:HemY protein